MWSRPLWANRSIRRFRLPALDGFTPDKAEVVFAVESVTEDLTVVVTYSGAARNYTVKHLFQNVEGTAYAEDEALRETLEGTTGLDTAAQAKTVEGFTALPITQVKVASSGETVVEVKYDRNSYLLTWNTDGGSYIEPQMLKYGAAVSAPADPTKVGLYVRWVGFCSRNDACRRHDGDGAVGERHAGVLPGRILGREPDGRLRLPLCGQSDRRCGRQYPIQHVPDR